MCQIRETCLLYGGGRQKQFCRLMTCALNVASNYLICKKSFASFYDIPWPEWHPLIPHNHHFHLTLPSATVVLIIIPTPLSRPLIIRPHSGRLILLSDQRAEGKAPKKGGGCSHYYLEGFRTRVLAKCR